MKKILIIILLALGFTGCTSASKYDKPIDIKYDEFIQKIENKETFTILLWQTGCSHCEAFEPTLNKVIKKYDIEMYSMDIVDFNNEQIAKLENKVFTIGTPMIVYFKNGVAQSSKLSGERSQQETIDFFKEYKIIG